MTSVVNQTEEWVMINFEVLNIESPQRQAAATSQLRKMLCTENDPPIQEIIDCGAIPRLLESLRRGDNPELQFESAWVLTNIASGSTQHTTWLVQQGVIPLMVQLLSSSDANVREQAVWALGNIAGDSAHHRDLVIEHGRLPLSSGTLTMRYVIQIVLSNISATIPEREPRLTMLRTATWTLSNLLRSKPQVPLGIAIPTLPALVWLCSNADEEVASDAMWALSHVSDGPNDRIEAVIQAGALPITIHSLAPSHPSDPSSKLVLPALHVAGNIASGDDGQTQQLLQAGVLGPVALLLSNTSAAIRKEACWTLSNILAGTQAQIQAVIDSGLVPRLVEMGMHEREEEVRKEAVWALSNAVNMGRVEHVGALVSQGCLTPICSDLHAEDTRRVLLALQTVGCVFSAGQSFDCEMQSSGVTVPNPFHEALRGLSLARSLNGLATHVNEDIQAAAAKLLLDCDSCLSESLRL